MVKLVVDNTKGMRFSVMWKKIGAQKAEKRTYTVTNLQELARVLFHAEQVTRESVETIYIHHHFDDGKVVEVVAIDNTDSADVNPDIIFSDLPSGGSSTTKKKGWVIRETEQHDAGVVSAVFLALQKAKDSITAPKKNTESQTKPNLKLLNKEGLVMEGIFYQAYPAESRPKEIKK